MAGVGEPVGDAPVGVRRPVLRDQTVALEAVEGRVDLPDVQRPGRAGGRVELRAQLVAVAGAALEERQQSVSDGHGYGVCILGMPEGRGLADTGERRVSRDAGAVGLPSRDTDTLSSTRAGSWSRCDAEHHPGT